MPPFRKLLAEVRIHLEEMSIQHNMHFQSGLLSVDASGEFSLEDAKQAFLELLKAIAHYQAEKILLDGRKVKGEAGGLGAVFFGEFRGRKTHKVVVEHKIVPRFAYVIHE